jgi:hypothetical protein
MKTISKCIYTCREPMQAVKSAKMSESITLNF